MDYQNWFYFSENQSGNTQSSNSKRKEFDELVVVASAVLFMVAGSDTSANTLAFACYQLAKNPQIQNKLREEIDAINSEEVFCQTEL